MASALDQTRLLTQAQRRAVTARGNVLVMAGAGTGKTKTLVERCLDCLERDRAAMDELLVVTFTEAAAAEMRDRLRRAIEERSQDEFAGGQPGFWTEQLARFDLAHIGTLHGFCLKLVREHFYELGLDPHLTIVDEGQARQLANETLYGQFTAHYAGDDQFSLAVQHLIQTHGGGRDDEIRKLVLRLHHYSQSRPDAAGWLKQQRMMYSCAKPDDWLHWLRNAIESWRAEWLLFLESLKSGNEKAAELFAILSILHKDSADSTWREAATATLARIISADGVWPARRKTALRRPLESFFEEAQFLESLVSVKNGNDPLTEDWLWVRGQMDTLLRLTEEFSTQLADRKQENGVLDFHDLEQFALKLLWDFSKGLPTSVALGWRVRLKFVFVDEYQDINAAQDKIIQGLSRENSDANRFLVGDVKQSIYRFRLADPTIFRKYARNWRGDCGETIPLSENFRSREVLLNLVNSIFNHVMREEVGGLAYDRDAELKFGGREYRGDSDLAKNSGPCAELLLRLKNKSSEGDENEGNRLAGLDDVQSEARLVARRIKQLITGGFQVFDGERKVFRPARWRDIAVLLRSPRDRSEIFAREFERAGIPLAVARGGFYESAEILDLLSLLQLLDNPLQDVPCIAVLRSPLVGLSLDELAEIRLAARERHFWTALNRSAETGLTDAEATNKITKFLERFSRWRKMAKLVSLSQCIEDILAETLYEDWLRAQPQGIQRVANVAAFRQLAQQFDQFQRQGLFRFLKFIEAQQDAEAEPEVSAIEMDDAVRLMSIHQSKGLEFPVVVLADLAKQFNEQDLRGDIIFDEEFGLCPKIKPPHLGGRYPSLPHWLAQRRQKRELRGEELRLLYVALTRARDHLILAASINEKSWNEKWLQPQPLTTQKIAGAKCFADWLALWFSNQVSASNSAVQGQSEGELENLYWKILSDVENGDVQSEPVVRHSSFVNQLEPQFGKKLESLGARLEWIYPFLAATQRKAKSSVTALRREAEELDLEAEKVFPEAELQPLPHLPLPHTKLSAAEVGAAHHKFLQHFALEKADDIAAEAGRLVQENYLTADEQAALNVAALDTFWKSPLGRKIRSRPDDVRRELPFTARFRPAELANFIGAEVEAGLEQEFVTVQGVADLVVLRPDEIWLVDFKTDEVSARELPAKTRVYSPQLQIYASALEKVFARKVTLRALHFLAVEKTVEI